MLNENIRPGIQIHASRNISALFTNDETSIANFFAKSWYITNAGSIKLANSKYKYFLIKSTLEYEELYGISKEIVVILSPYIKFQARELDAFEGIYNRFQENRPERICYILVSPDLKIENALSTFLTAQESQIVIPMTYREIFDNINESSFIKARFQKYFFQRNLFDMADPLKKDIYFFGRNELTLSIIDKHRSGQNAGLFGLRKTGKTSIIYDIIRKIPQRDSIGILIDCQNTSFSNRRWNNALYYIIMIIYKECKVDETVHEEEFTEINASILFEKYITDISSKLGKRLLLLFDEIENITFGKSSVNHWAKELDFVYFWQSIRSIFQSTRDVFTFCILGTNPKCIEDPIILEKDNPIFNLIEPKYIPGFDVNQTKDMVRRLGKLMGITFDESIYSKLCEEYGGHPFLIRQVCSVIHTRFKNRPVNIDRQKYAEVKDFFNQNSDYFEMILVVLQQFYNDEYEMLKLLAKNELDTFSYYAQEDRSYIKHLLGYGIIKQIEGSYDFLIDSIKNYILRKESTIKLAKSDEDIWISLVINRNNLELRLRKMVNVITRISKKNEVNASKHITNVLYGADANKYATVPYNDLFDSKKSRIYFKNITTLILADWESYRDYWRDKDQFTFAMNIVNKEGRFDAHASVPSSDEIALIDSALKTILKGVDKFNEVMGF
ncbi:MAG TPA: AAA-like domain-containing protein [Bacilli bacterium]|nr:AAA-like domain-containing protein [Bacilli bacterium]